MKDSVTIYSIAEKAGVSIATVTRAFKKDSVIRPETREKILNIAAKYNYRPSTAAINLSREPVRIGVILHKDIFCFYNDLHRGIMAAQNELSVYKVISDIRLIDKDDPHLEDILISYIDLYISQSYCGIVINIPVCTDRVNRKVNEACERGMKVATLVWDLPDTERLFTSCNNTRLAGKIAAELMSIFCRSAAENEIIQLAVFSGNMNTAVHQQLVYAFRDEIHSYRCFEIVSYCDTNDNYETAERMTEQIFNQNPGISGIYISSANSIPVCKKIEQYNLKGIKIIASDVFPELEYYIKNGIVSASIFQDPFGQAHLAMHQLFQCIINNVVPEAIIKSHPQIVLKSNLELYHI